jgi:hypothetical protein
VRGTTRVRKAPSHWCTRETQRNVPPT